MNIDNTITSLLDYFNQNNIKIINTHIGKSICLIAKHNKIEDLYTIKSKFPNINILDIIPTVAGQYHYILVDLNN